MTYMETKQWAIAPILQVKLNMLNLSCKTVQEFLARLQHVGYLARCYTQYIARYFAHNIALCRQALTNAHVYNFENPFCHHICYLVITETRFALFVSKPVEQSCGIKKNEMLGKFTVSHYRLLACALQ